jgi:hypothetical protein
MHDFFLVNCLSTHFILFPFNFIIYFNVSWIGNRSEFDKKRYSGRCSMIWYELFHLTWWHTQVHHMLKMINSLQYSFMSFVWKEKGSSAVLSRSGQCVSWMWIWNTRKKKKNDRQTMRKKVTRRMSFVHRSLLIE